MPLQPRASMADDALIELARAHAIDLEYHDIWGNVHRAPDASLRAVFAAMGVDASSEAAAAARLEETRAHRWREILPPAVVLREDAPAWIVRLHLDLSTASQTLRWVVRAEGGARHEATFAPAILPRCGEATIDSRVHIAVELELRLSLPLSLIHI